MNILIIIPARGGSKGIPRKNLRSLAGKPLISYSITTCLKSRYNPDVFVTSEDEEILNLSQRLGAKVLRRDKALSQDFTTLDPVIYDAYLKAEELLGKKYNLIVTVQPTSPLLKTKTLDQALDRIINNSNIDTIISAVNDTHLTWRVNEDKYVPNYKERVNRQYLQPVFKETGGFLITRSTIINSENRIGSQVDLFVLNDGQEIDIDSYQDWNLCEYYLKRKRILFVVTGNRDVGLGHVYNVLSLANEILNHELIFLVDNHSKLALDKISENNYPVFIQENMDIINDIININPYLVINDILDTHEDFVRSLKKEGYKTINFEDLGIGAQYADVVINAMYPEREVIPNHYFGHKYFCLKSEFLTNMHKKELSEDVKTVLITFGGVDPNNFTGKVLETIYKYCVSHSIQIKVIAGLGYKHSNDIKSKYPDIDLFSNVSTISDYMTQADLAFTSAGRTTFEIASFGVPTIVLCQNQREQTHFFASQEYGFVNMGLGTNLSITDVFEVFSAVVNDYKKRKYMHDLMLKQDIKNGKNRVLKIINDILNLHT